MPSQGSLIPPTAHSGLQSLSGIVGKAGMQGDISPHYYQYIPGYGYFLMPGTPGDATAGSAAAEGAAGQGAANLARKSQKGCACLKEWSVSGTPCENYCCNPDNSAGDWCFVEEESCEGDTWGMCSSPSAMVQMSSNITRPGDLVNDQPKVSQQSSNQRTNFLQKRHDYVEGAECDCES